MSDRSPSEKELKLTAALYAKRSGVLEHLQEFGRLPETIPTGGAAIGTRLLIEERGTDITLTPDEQLVYDAILREGRLPGGSVCLVKQDDGPADQGGKKKR